MTVQALLCGKKGVAELSGLPKRLLLTFENTSLKRMCRSPGVVTSRQKRILVRYETIEIAARHEPALEISLFWPDFSRALTCHWLTDFSETLKHQIPDLYCLPYVSFFSHRCDIPPLALAVSLKAAYIE